MKTYFFWQIQQTIRREGGVTNLNVRRGEVVKREAWRDGKIKGMHHWYIPFIVYSFNTLCYHHISAGPRTRLLVDRVYTYPGLSTGNPPVGTTISIVACVPTVDGAAISIFNAQFIDSAFIGKAI